jgi:hypothetical protein
MESFCLDHDVRPGLARALEAGAHLAAAGREVFDEMASDPAKLLFAARQGRVFVTQNGYDFKVLHEAWRHWPLPLRHAGILVLPQQRWTPEQAAEQIDQLARSGTKLTNELYEWKPGEGWVRYDWSGAAGANAGEQPSTPARSGRQSPPGTRAPGRARPRRR